MRKKFQVREIIRSKFYNYFKKKIQISNKLILVIALELLDGTIALIVTVFSRLAVELLHVIDYDTF